MILSNSDDVDNNNNFNSGHLLNRENRISSDSHINSPRLVLLLSSFYKLGNCGSEKLFSEQVAELGPDDTRSFLLQGQYS